EDSSNEVEVEIDEETIIKYCFQRSFSYEEIIHFLAKRHDHEIKEFFKADDSGEVLEAVRKRILEIIHGPGSCGGYRTVWHTLTIEDYR
ncbi:unnamed protein product, partial [Pocillopora meandrina]